MKKTITVLPVNEMKIIKQINLVIQNRNEIDITAGIILYEREFSEIYKFKEKPEEENDFFHFINYPKQEDYPSDELDSRILKAINLDFPRAQIKSDLLFSSSDVEHYKNITTRPFEKAELTFVPDFSGMNLNLLPRKSFTGFSKHITIYLNGSTEMIRDRIFKGLCPYENHLEFYDQLDEIKFL